MPWRTQGPKQRDGQEHFANLSQDAPKRPAERRTELPQKIAKTAKGKTSTEESGTATAEYAENAETSSQSASALDRCGGAQGLATLWGRKDEVHESLVYKKNSDSWNSYVRML